VLQKESYTNFGKNKQVHKENLQKNPTKNITLQPLQIRTGAADCSPGTTTTHRPPDLNYPALSTKKTIF